MSVWIICVYKQCSFDASIKHTHENIVVCTLIHEIFEKNAVLKVELIYIGLDCWYFIVDSSTIVRNNWAESSTYQNRPLQRSIKSSLTWSLSTLIQFNQNCVSAYEWITTIPRFTIIIHLFIHLLFSNSKMYVIDIIN